MIANTLPKKVCLFIESGGPGGAERVVIELAAALTAENIEVCVVTLRTGWLRETLHTKGIRHILLPSHSSFDPGLSWRLAKILRQENVDVLHSHLLDSNFYGAFAARLAGIPHIATEHGDVHHSQRKKFLRFKLRIISLLCSKITAVSSYTLAALRSYQVPSHKVIVVPNPITSNSAQAIDPCARVNIRNELGIPIENHWLWLHVANLRPVKDQATLLQGFASSLEQTGPNQTLCLAGDGPMRKELEELALELNIGARLRFLGFRDDIPALLQAADGFVLTSLSEALPMSLLEAGNAGLFLISTDVGGVRDVVSEESAVLVEPGNWQALGLEMSSTIGNQDRSAEKANNARESIQRKFSLESVLNQYLTLYTRIASG